MIEVKNLSKRYGGRPIVDNLSLAIEKGKVFGFLGQNGAGKTTTIKMLVGLTLPNAGDIFVGGKHVTDRAMRENIGFMPEAPYFYDRLSGLEFLEFCGALFPRHKSREKYLDVLKELGIYKARNRPINTYSKGMKQRLGFAQVLVNDPEYFLDEPLDGLDPLGRREIKKIILELKARGKTVFFNSHILYDTEELCDEIGVIHEGRLLYSGPVKNFTKGAPLEKKFVALVEEESQK